MFLRQRFLNTVSALLYQSCIGILHEYCVNGSFLSLPHNKHQVTVSNPMGETNILFKDYGFVPEISVKCLQRSMLKSPIRFKIVG